MRTCLSLALVLCWYLGLTVTAQAADFNVPKSVREALQRELSYYQLSGLDPAGFRFSVSPEDPEFIQAIAGPYVFQIANDGSFSVRSDFRDSEAGKALTRTQRNALRRQAMQALDETGLIVFNPPGAVQHTLSVFTDASCPHCARFHAELPVLLAAGVKIRYLGFPRDGVESEGFVTSVSVWCSTDPRQALALATAAKPVPHAECDNPVEAYYYLGNSLDVIGTPSLIFEDGQMFTGYFSAAAVLDHLSGKRPLQQQ